MLRWAAASPALIRRLLVDDGIGLGDRVVLLFVLLYGQNAIDVVRLTVDEVERRDDNVLLRLGDDPCVMPGPVGCLLIDLVDSNRRGHATVGAPSHTVHLLFASSHPGAAEAAHWHVSS